MLQVCIVALISSFITIIICNQVYMQKTKKISVFKSSNLTIVYVIFSIPIYIFLCIFKTITMSQTLAITTITIMSDYYISHKQYLEKIDLLKLITLKTDTNLIANEIKINQENYLELQKQNKELVTIIEKLYKIVEMSKCNRTQFVYNINKLYYQVYNESDFQNDLYKILVDLDIVENSIDKKLFSNITAAKEYLGLLDFNIDSVQENYIINNSHCFKKDKKTFYNFQPLKIESRLEPYIFIYKTENKPSIHRKKFYEIVTYNLESIIDLITNDFSTEQTISIRPPSDDCE